MKRQNWWEMPKGPFWTPSRILSLLIFLVALAFADFPEDAPRRAAGMASAPLILGLLCIWFPDALSGFRGRGLGDNWIHTVDRDTPAEVLYWFGWVMLIVPGILFIVL